MTASSVAELSDMASAFDLSDDALSEAAQAAADSVQRMVARWKTFGTPDGRIASILRGIAKRHSIATPDKASLQETINRMCAAPWWRRALRKRFRSVEHAAILSGRVHRHAGAYVSDHAMKRAVRDKRRVAELLASLVAINQTTGEVLPLEDLAEQSLSNPANRRSALMVRIRGIEDYAKNKGFEALFLTITCPSRFHARHITGRSNDRYDQADPREAHAYLNNVWRRTTRKLGHDGIEFCGLRVVEPHHDGCPHWHVLVFTPLGQSERLIATAQAYALCDSPNEPGAAERRFLVEHIDPARGSAVGYVAKYISKSIDGEGVDLDDETGAKGADAASRIVAWARLWGIRQFQFFGVPSITPTRELYRLANIDVDSAGLAAAHEATKANDYGAWLTACEVYGLGFQVDYIERPSTRYRDEFTRCIKGLTASACDLQGPAVFVTRTDEWRIESKPREAELVVAAPAAALPWTRFNNCARIDFEEIFPSTKSAGPIEVPMRRGAVALEDLEHQNQKSDEAFNLWVCSLRESKNPTFNRTQTR
ncbi:replication endonuclease [Variovorax sp. HJSM1_2]|uniref:replication endonuclease n=1 Tax=Variovorax sp. HJSM1_2 TaxID=3366263 RepID=UPI003BBA62FB